jgi:hypothetical protein
MTTAIPTTNRIPDTTLVLLLVLVLVLGLGLGLEPMKHHSPSDNAR